MTRVTEPTTSSLLAGISHRQMLDMMAEAGIFCSPDKFCRILQDAQRRAIAHTQVTEEVKGETE